MINKVKAWLGKKIQFKVVEYYANPPGCIKAVRRIKDDAIFTRYFPIYMGLDDNSYLLIIDFHLDMINVDFEIYSLIADTISGTGHIDGLILNSDGNRISGLDYCHLKPKTIKDSKNDKKD